MDNDKETGSEESIPLPSKQATCKCWYDCRRVLADDSNRLEAVLKVFHLRNREQKLAYLMQLIDVLPIKKKCYVPATSRRKMSVRYRAPQVDDDNRCKRVCKTTFMQIFAMTDRKMENLIRKKKEQFLFKGKSPRSHNHNALDPTQPKTQEAKGREDGLSSSSPLPFLFVSANEPSASSNSENALTTPTVNQFEGAVYVEQTLSKQQVIGRMQAISQQIISLENTRREKETDIPAIENVKLRQRSQHLLDKLLYELVNKKEEYEDLTNILLQYD